MDTGSATGASRRTLKARLRRKVRAAHARLLRGKPRRVALVTGCPRSGTSAMLTWLGSSRETLIRYEDRIAVALHGFLAAVDRYERLYSRREKLEQGLRRLVFRDCTDAGPLRGRTLIFKEPVQATAVGALDFEALLRHLSTLFPGLRVVHMVRHPVPVVNSMLKRTWGGSLRDYEARNLTLDECVRTWNEGARILRESTGEGAYACRYEALVTQPDDVSRELEQFLGLRRMRAFAPRPSKGIDLPEETVGAILEGTREERQRLRYGEDWTDTAGGSALSADQSAGGRNA